MLLQHLVSIVLAVILMTVLTGCQAIADIFQAGFAVGAIVVLLLIGVVVLIVLAIGRRG